MGNNVNYRRYSTPTNARQRFCFTSLRESFTYTDISLIVIGLSSPFHGSGGALRLCQSEIKFLYANTVLLEALDVLC